MDELYKIDTFILLFMIVNRVLLSDLALQDDCLLVYCAVVWQTRVLVRMHAITVSSKSRL